MEYQIANLLALDAWAATFVDQFTIHDRYARIVTLEGDLGAGKTALVKAIARACSVSDEVTSPTFVIQREYEIHADIPFKSLVHLDAYRLEGKEELEYLGWHDTIHNPQNLIFLEWPQMVGGIDLPNVIHITITIAENEDRILVVS